jgi:hypothetical protein
MQFDLTNEIKELGVSQLQFTAEYVTIYNGKAHVKSPYFKNELQKTLTELKEKMVECGYFGDEQKVEKIIILISQIWVNYEETKKKPNNGKEEGKPKPKEKYFQVHCAGALLCESILVGIEGEQSPYFIVSNAGKLTVEESIEISDDYVIRPFESSSYINRPYSFNSMNQAKELIEKTRNETLDSLYKKVKGIWNKYIDESDFHISICSADTVFTYFQDKLGLTHYIFFIGDNDVGKSNNLHILNFLAYRNMLSTDMTHANIYSFLGCKYEGIGTICEDEADDIDEDREKMKIYKNGYTKGFRIHRTDTNTIEGRKQQGYNTFCFKAYGAEKLPDSFKAKGFNQRVVELPCSPGFPKYDISEVANAAGDESFEELLDELNEVRNALLIYRLLHHNERIPNIQLNIKNREKQLFKPVLRIFQNTNTFTELLPVVSNYVNLKRQSKSNTIHAFLYDLISRLIKEHGNDATLNSSDIWIGLQNSLEGQLKSALTFDSVEFGELSQKGIIQILKDVFDAKPPKHTAKQRQLIFNVDKLNKIGEKYKDVEIKVTDKETDEIHETDVGLDVHLHNEQKGKESECENNKNTQENWGVSGNNPSQASHVSQGASLKTKFSCRHCHDKSFETHSREEYERHVVINHKRKAAY